MRTVAPVIFITITWSFYSFNRNPSMASAQLYRSVDLRRRMTVVLKNGSRKN